MFYPHTIKGKPTFKKLGPVVAFAVNSANLDGTQSFRLSDGLLRNLTAFSQFIWVYKDTVGAMQFVSETTKLNDQSTRLQLSVNESDQLMILYRYAHISGTVTLTDTVTFPLNQWVSIGYSMDSVSNVASLYKNGIQVVTDNSQTITQCEDGDSFGGANIGAFRNQEETHLVGGVSFFDSWDIALTPAHFIALHNNGAPKCRPDRDAGLINSNNKASVRFGNFDDNAGAEITDQSGNGNNFANINSTPYTKTGLTVKCVE